MKKWILVLCAFLTLSFSCGCAPKAKDMKAPAQFYYCNKKVTYHSEYGVISAETRDVALSSSNFKTLLDSYLEGPVSKDLYSPFPADAGIHDVIIYDDIIHLILNESFAKLNGVELSLALSCLSMTTTEYTGMSSIQISIHNNLIYGKPSLMLNQNKLLLVDTIAPVN